MGVFVHHVAKPSQFNITVFSSLLALQLVITLEFATQIWLLYGEIDGGGAVISIL